MFLATTVVYAVDRNSYSQYSKHIMPVRFDPFFIKNFENCTPADYMDWTGTFRYVVQGKDPKTNACNYKSQYNPWLKLNRNQWEDYKTCSFNETQMQELSLALKEHSNTISNYYVGAYAMTGTKLEFLLYNYEYHGFCKLVWNKKTKTTFVK